MASPSAAGPPTSGSNSKSKKKGKNKPKTPNNAPEPLQIVSTTAATAADDDDSAAPKPTNGESTPSALNTPTSPLKMNGNIGNDVRLSLFAELEKDRGALAEEKRKTAALEQQLAALTVNSGDDKKVGKLEAEIADLRSALDSEKDAREDDRKAADTRLEEIEEERNRVSDQYNNLLERVTTIRNTLGERIKADAEEIKEGKERLQELEEQNSQLNDTIEALNSELEMERTGHEEVGKEMGSLRSRLNLAQQNWNREKEELVRAEKNTREELEATRQAMQDWEVIATEERSIRESLSDRVVELEETLSGTSAGYDEMLKERDEQATTIAGLQRALNELQDSHQKDRRELVESTSATITSLTNERTTLSERVTALEASLKASEVALEAAAPFESQVREKNLLIGKLRHEAVTLNDHLRKALRMLRRDNADDKIDKNLVTNVFLQFVSIQRGDTKKYEVLQLIASVLGWDETQREKAGLVRPGRGDQNASSESAGAGRSFWGGLTPTGGGFRRSPSTPSLGEARSPGLGSDAYDGSKDLWTSVLEGTSEKE